MTDSDSPLSTSSALGFILTSQKDKIIEKIDNSLNLTQLWEVVHCLGILKRLWAESGYSYKSVELLARLEKRVAELHLSDHYPAMKETWLSYFTSKPETSSKSQPTEEQLEESK